jgi:AraC-like DNA-binding protein
VNGSLNFWVAFLDPRLVGAAAAEMGLGAQPHVAMTCRDVRGMLAAFQRLYGSLRRGLPLLEQETRLAMCLRLLLADAGERRADLAPIAPHAGVGRAREFLHAHFADAIRLDQLAAASGMSRFHLAHVFSRTYGLSPHAYQNQLRVEAARRALRAGAAPNSVEVGFYDQSHLGRHFTRAWRITPAAYAGAAAAGRSLPPMTN